MVAYASFLNLFILFLLGANLLLCFYFFSFLKVYSSRKANFHCRFKFPPSKTPGDKGRYFISKLKLDFNWCLEIVGFGCCCGLGCQFFLFVLWRLGFGFGYVFFLIHYKVVQYIWECIYL